MKKASIFLFLSFLFFILLGCLNSGSSFLVLSIDYPDNVSFKVEGGVFVNKIVDICKNKALERDSRRPFNNDPSVGDSYAVFKTVGNKEPIVWITIYRSEQKRVSVILSYLKEYESSQSVGSLLMSIKKETKIISDQKGYHIDIEENGIGIFH